MGVLKCVGTGQLTVLDGMRFLHVDDIISEKIVKYLVVYCSSCVDVFLAFNSNELVVVERILNAKSVSAASPMAPACGLYLGQVKYDLH